jgi:GNAT superfamily N-acetyltransferase
MDEVAVRATEPSDAARLAEIWLDTAAYYSGLDPGAFRVPTRAGVDAITVGAVAEGSLSLVAEIDGVVAGFLDAHVAPPVDDADAQFVRELVETRVIVDALAVERRFWRRGAGGALLRAAEEWGRERGATLVCLDTYLHSPVSVPFYERHMGYERRSVNLRKAL